MSPTTVLTIMVLVVSAIGITLAYLLWKRTASMRSMAERFRTVIDVDAERERVLAQLAADQVAAQEEIRRLTRESERQVADLGRQRESMTTELNDLESRIAALHAEFDALDEEANLRSFGFYKPHYDFADSTRYQTELERIREQQKQMLKDKTAAVCAVEWVVSGSKAEGRKQTNHTLKLILRAFNGECDAAVARVRYNNIHVMEARIQKAWEAINVLVSVQQARIVERYRDLKVQELRLAHEYQEKVQDEKEEQRRIREQMREEEIAQRELERAREDAEREERRYQAALEKAREEVQHAAGAKHEKLVAQIAELQRLLDEARANKERAISRAQMTRSGYVYVISNLGAFGEDVFKIGMTRRLDPMDRIRELGDASVPFPFDVHAMIYSDDAPSLETELHRVFDRCRLNRVNDRKEFFRVAIDDIAAIVGRRDAKIELTRVAEAQEFRKSQAIYAEEAKARGGPPAAGGDASRPISV